MAENNNNRQTHTAWTIQRVGKKFGRWLEIGGGRIDGDDVHVVLDRLPIGGFTGYVRLCPQGEPPSLPQPVRPAPVADEEESES